MAIHGERHRQNPAVKVFQIGVDHRRIGVQQEWNGVFEIRNRCVKSSNDRIVIQGCHSDRLRHCQTRAAIPIAQSGRKGSSQGRWCLRDVLECDIAQQGLNRRGIRMRIQCDRQSGRSRERADHHATVGHVGPTDPDLSRIRALMTNPNPIARMGVHQNSDNQLARIEIDRVHITD